MESDPILTNTVPYRTIKWPKVERKSAWQLQMKDSQPTILSALWTGARMAIGTVRAVILPTLLLLSLRFIMAHLKRCQHRIQTCDEILYKRIVDFVERKLLLQKKKLWVFAAVKETGPDNSYKRCSVWATPKNMEDPPEFLKTNFVQCSDFISAMSQNYVIFSRNSFKSLDSRQNLQPDLWKTYRRE